MTLKPWMAALAVGLSVALAPDAAAAKHRDRDVDFRIRLDNTYHGTHYFNNFYGRRHFGPRVRTETVILRDGRIKRLYFRRGRLIDAEYIGRVGPRRRDFQRHHHGFNRHYRGPRFRDNRYHPRDFYYGGDFVGVSGRVDGAAFAIRLQDDHHRRDRHRSRHWDDRRFDPYWDDHRHHRDFDDHRGRNDHRHRDNRRRQNSDLDDRLDGRVGGPLERNVMVSEYGVRGRVVIDD